MKKIILLILLAVSYLANGEESKLNYEKVPNDVMESINAYSARTLVMMKKGGVKDFDYSEKSVKFLSEVIDEEGPTYSEKAKEMLPTIWGAYFGDALIKKYGGEWIKLGNTYAVLIDQSQFVFPMGKVEKHIINGKEDSIYGMYLVAATKVDQLIESIEKP
jgi:hypothetical protein